MQGARVREFEAFVAAHRERAVGLAWRLVGADGGAAEDVAQEAFVRAYRSLARFRGDAEMSTWFHRILLNEARRYRRWRWVRERFAGALHEETPDPQAGKPGDPALRKRIAHALERLSQGQREAFLLVHLEGMTVREAAAITGRATGTTKSHLHRALRALRAELEDLDPAPEASAS